ncbi:MAG TPA: hypothetical protein PLT65_04440 [Bacilli bacterium]|nr:hypothetical protein [Bacilli bacterium]
MQEEKIIKKYFNVVNQIVLSQMYLKEFHTSEDISLSDLKKHNPGHLGTSLSLNFILANLYYFINKNKLNSQVVIGTGHSGVSLLANQWLNGTLEKYNKRYTRTKNGLNNLISDFGSIIRSEINPQYPETIYDGGELGYSLGVAYGYAINTEVDIIPCIIGDGEAETGTLSSAWQLGRLLNTESKVLPIINLNGLKMGSQSFLSILSDEELIKYFTSLGYDIQIVDGIEKNIETTINEMQESLNKIINSSHPLIVFKSSKGFTLPIVDNIDFRNQTSVHKNPLQNYDDLEKMDIIRTFLKEYESLLFDEDDSILSMFDYFKIESPKRKVKEVKIDFEKGNEYQDNIAKLESYLLLFLKENNGLIFSPDEIYSNKLGKVAPYTIEILNENLLQALYQGYIQAGNSGFYISYESFMPIISSMISQYYKYLQQKKQIDRSETNNSLNYILTSTCWENTYSHQNPEFVNALLQRCDDFYTILYPKDGNNLLKCIEYVVGTKDHINIITTSKRHSKQYQTYNDANITIDTVVECENPEMILCVTGDYMLDLALEVYEDLLQQQKRIKIVYVTNPKILDVNSKNALSSDEFKSYFNASVPVIYLFAGYPSIIKSLLFDRNIKCKIRGYNDQISIFGNLENNLRANEISKSDIIELYNPTGISKKLRR